MKFNITLQRQKPARGRGGIGRHEIGRAHV